MQFGFQGILSGIAGVIKLKVYSNYWTVSNKRLIFEPFTMFELLPKLGDCWHTWKWKLSNACSFLRSLSHHIALCVALRMIWRGDDHKSIIDSESQVRNVSDDVRYPHEKVDWQMLAMSEGGCNWLRNWGSEHHRPGFRSLELSCCGCSLAYFVPNTSLIPHPLSVFS